MPQVVAPWTWRRMLRDHGPDDEGFLLAMLILNTYMDGEGFAYPGQPLWAKGARKSVRMLQRYIATARREGWLSVVNAGRGGKGWAFNGYRCCVPDWVELEEKDQRIGDALAAQEGDIEGDDIAVSVPAINGHDTSMSSALSVLRGGDDTAQTKVTTSGADGDDKVGHMLPTSGWRTNSGSENSRSITHAQKEAALTCSALVKSVSKKTEEEKAEESRKTASLQRRTLIQTYLEKRFSDEDIARFLGSQGVTLNEVEDVRIYGPALNDF